MKKKRSEPRVIRPDDVNPHHDWKRPLQAPGHTQVDFEERVNFRRLHNYRLARVRQALAGSGLGALLSFDQHNIRYTTSTVIGEWARDIEIRGAANVTDAEQADLESLLKSSRFRPRLTQGGFADASPVAVRYYLPVIGNEK